MKFIHTADWHLGNTMHDIDRTRESEAFLVWLKNEIVASGAQALVIAGDIFDVVNPSNNAKSQYYRFLASLLGTCCTNVVVVGGNHDSGALLDTSSEILDALNIKVVGSINNRSVEDLVVELKDGSGNVIGICCAVPFMRDVELENFYKRNKNEALATENADAAGDAAVADENRDSKLLEKLYADVYDCAVKRRGDKEIPIIATGHLYAADLSGREETIAVAASDAAVVAENAATINRDVRHDDGVRDVVGTLGNVNADAFPEGFNYVALGHIHYATMVAKNPKIRYSGSPFVMGFDEARCKHCILAVDANSGTELHVERINVPRTIRYEQFEGDVPTLKQQLRNLEAELLKAPAETYVDILLTSGDFVNLNDALENEEAGKHFVVKRHRIGRNILKNGSANFSDIAESTKQFTQEDYFKMLIASNVDENVDSEKVNGLFEKFIGLFNEAVEKAHQNG